MRKQFVFITGIFLILLLVLNGIQSYAQVDDASVAGTVLDRSSRQPVEFASVQLLNPTDSAVLQTTVTDRRGKFLIEKIAAGNYVVAFSFIGYSKIVMPVTVDQKKENLGSIEIGMLSKDLSEVVVTTRKSLLNSSIDRKIYNVSQDIMAVSGSASDILKNIPSVEVDIDGQVMLRGSTEVMILINGRPSPLMGKTRAEVLLQLPANSIERIEIITNPSAKFKPDGTSGIINIVLKKNIKPGWNGTLSGNASNRDRYNSSISLNFRPGKLNLFGSYAIRQDNRIRMNQINREFFDSAGKTDSFYLEESRSTANPFSHLVSLGADYIFNEHNSIGISGSFFYYKMIRREVAQRFYRDKNHFLTANSDRIRYDPEKEIEKDATVYWQHDFPEEDHELRLEFTASGSNDKEDNHFTNVYHLPSLPSTLDNTLIKEIDQQQEVTFDYTKPLNEDAKLEMGYDGSFNQIDMDFYAEYYDTTQLGFVKDITRSNQFLYSEGIHAVYGTYEKSFGEFGFTAGLRGEQVFLTGELVTKDSLISNRYFKVYPTLHLSWELKKGELQLNYSKRVNRPDGDELNPFPEYRDPYNLHAGNPKLVPEIIHSVELGYKWQDEHFTIVPSLYYRYKINGFTSVTIPLNDSVLLTTEQNLANDRSAGLELIFSVKAGKFVSANLSSNFFYTRIDASNLGYNNSKSIVSMSTNLNSTFTLTPTTMLQVSCNYRSARLTAQGKSYPSFVLNSGLRQNLFKKKVSLTLTASDILKTQRQKNQLNSQYFEQLSIGRRDGRVFYLGISYRFGRSTKKDSEEKMQFDDAL